MRSQGFDAQKRNDIEDHLPLVAAMVRRFPPGRHEPEELYQQGCIGLLKAFARYDPGFGTAFSTYAVPMIIGEMRMLSRMEVPIHIPRPERERRQQLRRAEETLACSLGREPTLREIADLLRMDPAEVVLLMEEITVTSADAVSDDGRSLFDKVEDPDDWQTRLELRDLLSRLPERDQQLMTLRHINGCSQAETAQKLNMTQIQVSRREKVLRRMLQKAWYES